MRLGLVLWLGLATPAWARSPQVDCPALDHAEVARALDAELAEHPDVAVRVTCPEPDLALLELDGRRRRVDLRDVPAPLRARLVALAAGEVLSPAEPSPPAPIPIPRAAAGPSLSLEPQLGLRVYRPTYHVVPLFAAELAYARWSGGVSFLSETGSERLGEVRLSVLTATLGVRLACAESRVRVCLEGRADAGLAWVDSAPGEGVEAREPRAPYLAGGVRGGLGLPGQGASARLTVDVGWAGGLVARGGADDIARADGLYLALGLGVKLW